MSERRKPDSRVDRIRDSLANVLLLPSKFIGARRLDSRVVIGPPFRFLRLLSVGLSLKVTGEQRLQRAMDELSEPTEEEFEEQIQALKSQFIDYDAFEAAYDEMTKTANQEDWSWAKRKRAADALRDAHRRPSEGS